MECHKPGDGIRDPDRQSRTRTPGFSQGANQFISGLEDLFELAYRESLTMVQAYALAHLASQSAIRSGVPEGAETASRAFVRETV